MNIIDIIAKKRDNKELNKEEISYFIQGYTKGDITDYQASALIMAMYLNGLTEEETTNMTLEMANSGEILDLSSIGENIIDKHSTGGVGDKITLILTPIIASLGIPVAKMSGRGLGFTGGTADKIEAIPGYRTDLSIDEFIENVKKHGISLITQTGNIAPADKKIYALRDTIACVGSLELIASSVMSKKIAAGANKIVLDVTVGTGAFMKSKEDALKLSRIMNKIGKLSGRETVCVLTNMDEPLGHAVGNTLEIQETIESLKGNIPEDVKQVIQELGAYIIKLSGQNDDLEENRNKIIEQIENGKGLEKFIELVQAQGGDIGYITGEKEFEKAKYIFTVDSKEAGYVEYINGEEVGKLSVKLGAGREKKEDEIDHAVGILIHKKVGDKVEVEETVATIYANDEKLGQEAVEELRQIYKITEYQVNKEKAILDIVF